jgi:hypothetical protein
MALLKCDNSESFGNNTPNENPPGKLRDTLGISQSAMTAYDQDQRRVLVLKLPILAKGLRVGLEELLRETNAAAAKRVPAPKQQKQMERIGRFLIAICFLQRIKQSALSAKMHGAMGRRRVGGRISAIPLPSQINSGNYYWVAREFTAIALVAVVTQLILSPFPINCRNCRVLAKS